MTKKSVSKTSVSGKKSSSEEKVNKILVENLVSLQKVLTNLSLKFDNLTKRLDGMIDLFEESAKTVVKGEIRYMEESKHTEKVLGKMDKLFEQNKLIARGLTLLNESTSGAIEDTLNSQSQNTKDFDASPEINNRGSPYAMPFSNVSQQPKPQLNQNQVKMNSDNRTREVGGIENFSNGRSFGAPKPTKLVQEADSQRGAKDKLPSSPPFGEF